MFVFDSKNAGALVALRAEEFYTELKVVKYHV